MELLPYEVRIFISVLVAGIAVCLVTYPILTHFKYRPTTRSTVLLFALGTVGGIIDYVLLAPVEAILGWMGQYHYVLFSLPLYLGLIFVIQFLLFFPMLLFLGGFKKPKAGVICAIAAIASAAALAGYWLAWFVV
jgi:hypothetical protein